MIIIEFILVFFIYLLLIPAVYYVTEVKRLPNWLQFPPFHCRKCLTFWSLMFAYLIIGLSFNLYILLITGIILAILTAISMHIEEKNKTIKV